MTALATDQTRCGSAPEPGLRARFQVRDWAAIGLGLETSDAWRDWARTGLERPTPAAPSAAMPALLRRRITAIGQSALRAAYPLARADARYILCSRHGEFRRTLSLLQSIARGEESSPADFSLSVHNALAGLLSIATSNHAGHTAVAAGADSFGFGLVEALGCLREHSDQPVLLVYFDEALPSPYSELPDVHNEPGVALALLLAPADFSSGDITVSAEPASCLDGRVSATNQAVGFLQFLLSERTESEARGDRMIWRWHRNA